MGEKETTAFRSLAARGNYLAFDRPDIAYAVKECSRDMSRPTAKSWDKLRRLAKYLKHKPRLVWKFYWQDVVDSLDTYTDANSAGCKASRKSTSGGVIMAGSHTLKLWMKRLVHMLADESTHGARMKTTIKHRSSHRNDRTRVEGLLDVSHRCAPIVFASPLS